MIKKTIKFLIGFLIFFIIRILSFFIKIRIGKFPSDRIGPFVTVPEIFLIKKEKFNIKSLDFWSHDKSKEPNNFLAKIISREINFVPKQIYSFLDYFLSITKNKYFKKNFYIIPHTRDIHDLLDNFDCKLKLKENEIAESQKILLNNNIDIKKKFVCLNVRDAAYLSKMFPNQDMSYHDRRDANVNDYVNVIKHLISKNYIVFRMGKIMAEEVNYKNENFIDYAFSSFRSDMLDVYLGSKCYMTISTGSGWDGIPFAFRRPILYTNLTSYSKMVFSSKKHMSLFKLAKDKNGNFLKINQLLDYDLKLITNIENKNNNTFSELEYIPNTEKDLIDATTEFENYLLNNFKLSLKQSNYQKKFFLKFNTSLVTDIYGKPAHGEKIRAAISSKFLENNENILF